jgi:arsenite transporter
MTKKLEGISFFERYLTLWVAICIVAGIALGKLLPGVPATLEKFEYANVSLPIAILIWIMIYPMMLKIDFTSVVNAVKMPKGLTVTLVVNWLIKPFTMFGIAWLFFHLFFSAWIPADLAKNTLPEQCCWEWPLARPWCSCGAISPKETLPTRWCKWPSTTLIIIVAFIPLASLLVGHWRHFHSLGHTGIVGGVVCGDTVGIGNGNTPLHYCAQRVGLFGKRVHQKVPQHHHHWVAVNLGDNFRVPRR